MGEPILSARGLVRRFKGPRGRRVTAVDRVDVDLAPRSTHAVVGESGSGKSTLCRMLATLDRPDAGSLSIEGVDPWSLRAGAFRRHRRQVQLVFQDAAASFDPRLSIRESVGEAFVGTVGARVERGRLAGEALARCGLAPDLFDRSPWGLSGGELQRAALARSISCEPSVLLLDEPVTALDMSIRAQILDLLGRLKEESAMAYLLVSHDLPMVSHVADSVSVMFAGRVVERGTVRGVLGSPQHPYTADLIAAIPGAGARTSTAVALRRGVTDRTPVSGGCPYRLRCDRADEACASVAPDLAGDRHLVACHHPG